MRIELGGVYKDGNGDKIGPMTRSATGGDTPWYCRNNGLYRDDGSFIHNDPHGNNIVSEWVDDSVVEYTMALDEEQAKYLQDTINGDVDALWMAFTWSDTPQGHEYWCDQANKDTPLDIEALKEIQRQCVTGQVGTLSELGVKAGDVVELVSWSDGDDINVGMHYTIMDKHPKGHVNALVAYNGTGYFHVYGNQCGYIVKFRIISRADAADTKPKTWSEMTDAEKGALLLAYHEGKVIEWIDVDCPTDVWKICPNDCLWDGDFGGNGFAYRIKPEPVVEGVTMTGSVLWGFASGDEEAGDTHRITFITIDGEPDCGSVKMEAV